MMHLGGVLLLCLLVRGDGFHCGGLPRTSGKRRAPRLSVVATAPALSRNTARGDCGTSLLMSSNDDIRGEQRRPPNRLRLLLRRLSALALQGWTRFRSLPKRARMLSTTMLVLLSLSCGLTFTSNVVHPPVNRPVEVAYSSFMDLVEQQRKSDIPNIDNVRVGRDQISFRLSQGVQPPSNGKLSPKTTKKMDITERTSYLTAFTRQVAASPELVRFLRKHDITFAAAPTPGPSPVALAAKSMVMTFYLLLLWRMYRAIGGGTRKDSPGKLAGKSDTELASFDDIQGIDGAKMEVMELVDTLRNPEKYAVLGARAPTGLLLEGPPGTGKTMLARATAASAGVPLIYCSGSDFVEMYVGRGAARVRQLFERADRLAPCIIFIDELDALGKSRSDADLPGAFGRGNDEAEQTLNQLLACMDGLDSSRRICVLAATNRRQILDKALVRPGRFDRIVKLKLPDGRGREAILRVHCQKLPGFREGQGVDPNRPGALGRGRVVDLGAVAALTDGFSGAELEYLVNEAAIRAVRRVSAQLREGGHPQDITPHVDSRDFEASLADFYDTRRNQGGLGLLKNVWSARA